MAGFNGPIALQQDLGFPTDLPTPRFEANTDVDDAENNSVALENGEKRTSPVEGPLSQHFRANNVWTLVCPQLFRIGRAD